MASVAKFEEACEMADQAAKKAVGHVADTSGSLRGPLQAQLATMWLARAQLEHSMLHIERLEREMARMRERIRALEAGQPAETPMPDIFADDDIPTVGV